MLNPVREREEDYIEVIRYRRRLKIFENFLLLLLSLLLLLQSSCFCFAFFVSFSTLFFRAL